MKRNTVKFAYLIALFLVVGTSTVSAQSQKQSGIDPQGQVSLIEAEDLVYMREEEKLARDSYQVLAEKWGLAIFSNISRSEQRHMDALEVLLDAFFIIDPIIDESDVGSFENEGLQALFDGLMLSAMQSETEALKVGGAIEETDILDIQHAIERSGNQDVIATYENLLCGSRNHLRAFVRQIESYGEAYTPILLSVNELNAIIGLPMERDCGSNQQRPHKDGGSSKGNGNRNGSKG